MLRRIVSGFKDTDRNTQLSERGIVVVLEEFLLGFGVGGWWLLGSYVSR
jgi:hypothetical protein